MDTITDKIFLLLRAVRGVHRSAFVEGWDVELGGGGGLQYMARGDLDRVIVSLLKNTPVSLKPYTTIPQPASTYAFVEASSTERGALIFSRGRCATVHQHWKTEVNHSVHAEPLGASALLGFLEAEKFPGPGGRPQKTIFLVIFRTSRISNQQQRA